MVISMMEDEDSEVLACAIKAVCVVVFFRFFWEGGGGGSCPGKCWGAEVWRKETSALIAEALGHTSMLQ